MSFRIAQKTLERLEWPQLVTWLRDECHSPQARSALATWLSLPGSGVRDASPSSAPDGSQPEAEVPQVQPFPASFGATTERLRETSEARDLLDHDLAPGLAGLPDLGNELGRAEKGAALPGLRLRDLATTLGCVHDVRKRLCEDRRERAPALAALAELIGDHGRLERLLEASVDRSGEVRDGASQALRRARRDVRSLSSELQSRIEGLMRNSTVRDALSDDFYTVRNDRYVLPVRSEARSKVPGIVHDASNSGTTVYIEPQGLVDLNNRLKQAELDAAREVERVLRELSAEVAKALPELRASFEALALVDFAFARGRLSQKMEGVEATLTRDGHFELLGLRHPLLAVADAVPNDLRLGRDFSVLVLSGPNAGGKTVAMTAIALAALLTRAGLHVPALPGARVSFVDQILADIGDEQDIRASLSTFSAHMLNLAAIVKGAGADTLVVLDEIGVGTDPNEGAALAQSILEALAASNARVVTTTHYSLLKELAANDERFCNASVDFDPETLAPTYRIHIGTPGASSAASVAARMGMPEHVLSRAAEIAGREERELERLMGELAANRASLASEQRRLEELQAENETTRDEYRSKLDDLQQRREQILDEMKRDLEHAFGDARAEIAAVVRTLQRGPTQRDATHARKKLDRAAERAADTAADLETRDRPEAETAEPAATAIDWERAQPGDPVLLPGGARGVLDALPDRKGRAAVRAGSSRLVVPAAQLTRPLDGNAKPAQRSSERVQVERQERPAFDGGGGTAECDLRGLRVEEALAKLDEALDRAVTAGRDALLVIHGIGTGALRSAVQAHLATIPYVGDWQPESDGATAVKLGA